jgi:hypothetical protein
MPGRNQFLGALGFLTIHSFLAAPSYLNALSVVAAIG